MRIRHKAWARPEIAASDICKDNAFAWQGKWRSQFARPEQPLYIELGCGKGGWVSQAAVSRPGINFLALDIKSEMLAMARRKTDAAFAAAGRPTDNVLLSILNIERISEVLSPADAPDRIYINFCNPWPKMSHKKRRLTHPRQLGQYASFLRGELHFKTDDADLFNESKEYFAECGWEIRTATDDLHADEPADNIRTEHENMFTEMGLPIHFLIARPPADAFGQPVPDYDAVVKAQRAKKRNEVQNEQGMALEE